MQKKVRKRIFIFIISIVAIFGIVFILKYSLFNKNDVVPRFNSTKLQYEYAVKLISKNDPRGIPALLYVILYFPSINDVYTNKAIIKYTLKGFESKEKIYRIFATKVLKQRLSKKTLKLSLTDKLIYNFLLSFIYFYDEEYDKSEFYLKEVIKLNSTIIKKINIPMIEEKKLGNLLLLLNKSKKIRLKTLRTFCNLIKNDDHEQKYKKKLGINEKTNLKK